MTPPLGYPTVRVWELTEDSSRYDRMRAAPSDDQMVKMWIAYATAFAILSTFNLIVLLSVVLKKQVRKSPFNQYLIALMFPDVLFTGVCAIQCSFLAGMGGYAASGCLIQSFYLVWAIAANSWLNGTIMYKVHQLLRANKRRMRYSPPTQKHVVISTVLVYVWATFVASWGILGIPWLPEKTDSMSGLVCMPVEYDHKSSLFFWLAFLPCLNFIPLGYVFYVTYDVVRHKLLPPDGRTREIAVFFFRIVVVFIVMWLPAIVVFFAGSGVWVLYFSGLWAHLLGAVSAAVSLLKSDVQSAVRDLVCCRTWKANREFDIRSSHTLASLGGATLPPRAPSRGRVHISGFSLSSVINAPTETAPQPVAPHKTTNRTEGKGRNINGDDDESVDSHLSTSSVRDWRTAQRTSSLNADEDGSLGSSEFSTAASHGSDETTTTTLDMAGRGARRSSFRPKESCELVVILEDQDYTGTNFASFVKKGGEDALVCPATEISSQSDFYYSEHPQDISASETTNEAPPFSEDGGDTVIMDLHPDSDYTIDETSAGDDEHIV